MSVSFNSRKLFDQAKSLRTLRGNKYDLGSRVAPPMLAFLGFWWQGEINNPQERSESIIINNLKRDEIQPQALRIVTVLNPCYKDWLLNSR